MINYKEICDNLKDESVFKLLEQLGAEPLDKGEYILCRTICHHSDDEEANYKLYYYKNTHIFYCYSSCQAMTIFKFLKNYYETRDIVYNWYEDILEVILNCSIRQAVKTISKVVDRSNYEPKKIRKELANYSEGIMDCFVKAYPSEWINDGITKNAIDKYNIRYSISQNKIIIPHYDINNKLVGIRGRALNKEDIEIYGKYMPVQIEGKWYSHPLSLNLYGLNINKDNIRNRGVAFICEGEKSVLQAESFSFSNCVVASCGSNINKFQIDLLIRYCTPREIVICYDNEEIKEEEKYFNKLYNMCKKYNKYCTMSFIYDRNNTTPLKSSPTDCGEKVFMKLLSERIKV